MPKISEDTYRERRAHILQAARRCFARSGIGISVDDVCEAAGVSKGAFYGYFRSKDAVFEALARDHGAMIQALAPPMDRDGLVAMLLDRASVLEPSFARVELDTMAYASRQPVLNAIFVENARLLHQAIQQALDGLALSEGLDRDRAAHLLETTTMGAFLTIALKGDDAVGEARESIMDSVDLILGR